MPDRRHPAGTPGRPTVRRAGPGDVDELVDLVRLLASYERAPDEVELDAVLLHRALFGATPSAAAHVAVTDGRTVGMAVWYPTFSTWTGRPGVHLEDLFVREEARGRGAATALLAALAADVVARGGARLEWDVLDWNEPAHAFYRRIGARPRPEWTGWRLDGTALVDLASSVPDRS